MKRDWPSGDQKPHILGSDRPVMTLSDPAIIRGGWQLFSFHL